MTKGEAWWWVAPVDEDRRRDVGFAMPVERDRSIDLKHSRAMLTGELVADWGEAEYVLDGGDFGDYPRELRAYRLCSQRLRDVPDRIKSPLDRLQWLSARVRNAAGEERPTGC